MEKEYITIEAHRAGYSVDQIRNTATVGDLISYLSQWDEETPVYISNDNGYTYGGISTSDIDSAYFEEDEEEDEEE
jgi:hypothetical protein